MKRKMFSVEEMEIISSNPYTLKVTSSQIIYTKAFKEIFWEKLQEGKSPTEIIKLLGYEPEMLGKSRISGISMNIRKQAKSLGGFTEGHGRFYSEDTNN